MQKIKSEAFFLTQKGNPTSAFKLQEFEINAPENDEVLIEVASFGLNYADVMARNGLYKEAPEMPCVIGYEVVGKVIQVGEKVSADWVGKRVVAFTRFGGYAKHVLTQVHAIVEIDAMKSEDALALCTQSVTAFYLSDFIAPIQKNEIVLIHAAAGGVGTILIQLAKKRGATVIAKIGNENKRSLVEGLGADFVVNYNTTNYKEELLRYLGNKKLNASYNPVGGATFKTDLKLLCSGGKLFLYGGADLAKSKGGLFASLKFVWNMGLVIPIGLMMQSKSIIGVNMLKIGDEQPEVLKFCMQSVVQLYKDNKIKPQNGGIFDTLDLAKAHALLESGNSTGKLVVNW